MTESKVTFTDRVKWFFQLEPALIRAVLLALVAIAAKFGFQDAEGWVELVIDLFSAISGLLAFLWARPVITSMAKVIAFQPKPFTQPELIEPGNAVVDTGDENAVVALDEAAAATYHEGRHAA